MPRASEVVADPYADVASWLDRCSIISDSPPSSNNNSVNNVNTVGGTLGTFGQETVDVSDGAFDAVVRGTPYFGSRHSIVASENAHIVRMDNKYCYNVGREHRSNNAYLIVTRNKVEQACYCKCANTGCAEHRKLIAGPGNALSLELYPRPPMASVMPTSRARQIETVQRWSSAIKRQRNV